MICIYIHTFIYLYIYYTTIIEISVAKILISCIFHRELDQGKTSIFPTKPIFCIVHG